jgi:hypothetical protein
LLLVDEEDTTMHAKGVKRDSDMEHCTCIDHVNLGKFRSMQTTRVVHGLLATLKHKESHQSMRLSQLGK